MTEVRKTSPVASSVEMDGTSEDENTPLVSEAPKPKRFDIIKVGLTTFAILDLSV